jgi:uncharacterized protein YkwD
MRLLFLLIIFSFSPRLSYGQNVVNNDSVLYYFNFMLNEYRMINGLKPLVIDTKIKPFSESWANHMSSNNMVYHGNDDNSFPNRVKSYFPATIYCVENCCSITTPKTKEDGYVSCSIKELIPLIRKTYDGTANQFDYAYFAFILWKSSPTHNDALLDPNIKKFYLSSSPSKDLTYMEFVGTN